MSSFSQHGTTASQAGEASAATLQAAFRAMLAETQAESGRTLEQIADDGPVLLIFLRHFGCSFCRQTIDDVSRIRTELSNHGVQPVFVHLGTPERAKPYFDYYHLADVERISNPDGSLYSHPIFALPRVHLVRQIFRPTVWKGWLSGAIRKYRIGSIQEDGFQMPGIFFLTGDGIRKSFRYRTIADQPNYLKLISQVGIIR